MSPEELAQAANLSLEAASHSEKIKLFGWHLHVHKGQERFQPADVKRYYESLHLSQPSGFGGYFSQLVNDDSLLKDTKGYRLASGVRARFDACYGSRPATIKVAALLASLPEKIPDLSERTYLNEALICFKHAAFRAAIVMTWNLAFHHLCDLVLRKHLAEFNARWQIVYPGHHKKSAKAIVQMSDFNDELKESEVLDICRSAGITTRDQAKILNQKLERRNSAAHPSSVIIGQLQAEEYIDDLITNVVLKLA